jgi:hypothetical protein
MWPGVAVVGWDSCWDAGRESSARQLCPPLFRIPPLVRLFLKVKMTVCFIALGYQSQEPDSAEVLHGCQRNATTAHVFLTGCRSSGLEDRYGNEEKLLGIQEVRQRARRRQGGRFGRLPRRGECRCHQNERRKERGQDLLGSDRYIVRRQGTGDIR